ncbi:hypothetical protein NDU88_003135 [Pleurodeles waltl]|uniref:Uncharacterized protein n=1 Tax=Pleurodeles waltl TaxID=8319 RepID=A0AAV7NQ32_PLEWA|nr:hypothetical protein NDU88_003135 [Pleurodeles waltl]
MGSVGVCVLSRQPHRVRKQPRWAAKDRALWRHLDTCVAVVPRGAAIVGDCWEGAGEALHGTTAPRSAWGVHEESQPCRARPSAHWLLTPYIAGSLQLRPGRSPDKGRTVCDEALVYTGC